MDKFDEMKERFDRYLDNQASSEEISLLLEYLASDEGEQALRIFAETAFSEETGKDSIALRMTHELYERLEPSLLETIGAKRIKFPWAWAAAAILVTVLAIALYFNRDGSIINRPSKFVNQEVLPGGNRATLTLADGTKIDLDSAKTGIRIRDEDIKYNDGTAIGAESIVHRPSSIANTEGLMLTLTTPKGGQYQVILEDGTVVWLNAASTLTYPSRFTDSQRTVEVDGEAYFSVSPNSRPFVVECRGQQVYVLGTTFNISAYENDGEVMTTLLGGSIRVKDTKTDKNYMLSPNEQTILNESGLHKGLADADAAVAWKNGKFSFDGKSFAGIMNELSRWYNLKVRYEGPVPTDTFIGDAYRTDNLSLVLEFLKSSNIRYRIEPGGNGGMHNLVIINQ